MEIATQPDSRASGAGIEHGSGRSRARAQLLLASIGVLAAGTYGALLLRARIEIDGTTYFTLVDDAMISMRYADHLAAGHGFVWNIGEAPLQGFSNLGWTLVMAVPHALGVSQRFLPLVLLIISSAAVLVTAAATYSVARHVSVRPTAAVVAAIIVAFDFGLVFWATRGMELPLVTAALAIGLLAVLRWDEGGHDGNLWLATGAGMFAALIRLDAIVPFIVAYGLVATEAAVRNHRVRVRRSAAIPLLLTVFAATAIVMFQWAHFGDPLPNTYYLKVEGVSAAERLQLGIQVFRDNASFQLGLLGVLAIPAFLGTNREDRRPLLGLVLIVVTQIIYSLWVGGDYAEPQVHAPNRFVLLGLPSMAVLSAVGITNLPQIALIGGSGRHKERSTAVVAVASIVLLIAPNAGNWMDMWRHGPPLWKADAQRLALGLHLAENTPSDALVATHLAGQIPYYSGRKTLDLLGLNDRHIAHGPPSAPFRPGHNKWNYDYSIGIMRPDVVADEWGQVSEYLANSKFYRRLDNGLWVAREPRVNLNLNALGGCYLHCDE